MTQRARRDRLGWLTDNGVLLVVLTTLFWGGNAVAGKLAVGHISPLMLTFARWTIAAVLLLAIGWRYVRDDWPTIRQHLGYLLVAGACGFTVFNGLLYTALKYTSAINVAILQPAMPMFIFMLNFLVFRLHVQPAHAIGYSITLVGVMLVAGQGDFSRLVQLSFNAGDLIMLVAVLVYAAFSVALRAKPDLHWMSFLTVLVISGAIVSVPMVIVEYWLGQLILPTDVTGWGVIAYTAIFPSIVCQGFWIRANELLGGNHASVYLNLVPIFGAALSIVILGETFHAYHAAALTMVIGGIVIAQQFSRSG